MNWNRDNVLHFISLIRERPVIWDAQCQEYRNKQKRNDAFEDVALLMGCSIKVVNTKWISLRNQFSREKRHMSGARTGSGADAIYTTKWYAFKEMESLMDGSIPQPTYKLDYSEVSKYFKKMHYYDYYLVRHTSSYLADVCVSNSLEMFNLSSRFLKQFSEGAVTTFSGSLFHAVTTRLDENCFKGFFFDEFSHNFRECPCKCKV